MDLRLALYMAVALAYIAYPLYLLMTKPDEGRLRILGLGLVAYGVVALFWPEASSLLVLTGAILAVAGFGIYRGIVFTHLPWLALLAYCLGAIASPEVTDPIWLFVGSIVMVVCIERCAAPAVPTRK